MKKNFLTTKGFVILFASIIATIILIMSFAIYTVSVKSSALSIGAGEALDAFYAADAGIECGLLVLDLSTGAGMGPIGSMPVNIDCGGLPGVGNISFASGPYPFYYTGHLDPTVNPSACYAGTIDEDTSTSPPTYTIYAQGYNFCGSGTPLYGHPKFVERVLQVEVQ